MKRGYTRGYVTKELAGTRDSRAGRCHIDTESRRTKRASLQRHQIMTYPGVLPESQTDSGINSSP